MAGADWKTEAAKYSDDTGTKDSGGDLGSITKGEMVAEFDTAAFSLAKGEISQPVKSVYGYHIIQVESIAPAKQSTVDEVKSDIVSTLLGNKKDAMWQDWVTKMKAADKVVILSGMETTTTTAPAQTSTTTPSASSSTSDDLATTVAPSSTDTTATASTTMTIDETTGTTAAAAPTTSK